MSNLAGWRHELLRSRLEEFRVQLRGGGLDTHLSYLLATSMLAGHCLCFPAHTVSGCCGLINEQASWKHPQRTSCTPQRDAV
eukprot:3283683-Lingulodinium_polyedra.AAC.1